MRNCFANLTAPGFTIHNFNPVLKLIIARMVKTIA